MIPWAETAWSAAGRVASRAPLPLSQAGRDQARAWADKIGSAGVSAVYSSDERTSIETARFVADRTGAPHRSVAALAEVDLGLWGGLTTDELKRRYPKIFKRWYDDPTNVCPPEGEEVEQAYERLRESLARLTRKQGDRHVAVVLGPLAFALVRCWLEGAEVSQVRSMTHGEPLRYELTGGPGSEAGRAVLCKSEKELAVPVTVETASEGSAG